MPVAAKASAVFCLVAVFVPPDGRSQAVVLAQEVQWVRTRPVEVPILAMLAKAHRRRAAVVPGGGDAFSIFFMEPLQHLKEGMAVQF